MSRVVAPNVLVLDAMGVIDSVGRDADCMRTNSESPTITRHLAFLDIYTMAHTCLYLRLPPSIVAIALLHSQFALSQEVANHSMVDLTHPFNELTTYWPTEERFKLIREAAGVTERGYYYAANRFMCAEHGGTHIDAPVHFCEGGQTVDKVPLERLVGPGACVDVSRKCAADRDYLVSVEDFEQWEQDNKASLADRIVLIRTGFGRHWPDRKTYLGTEEQGKVAVAKLHFPGLDPAAADWLITRRRIRMVGIDTASIDYWQTRTYPTHVRLFRDNVPALENVAQLEKLPDVGFTVMALPMKIGGGSGAPCRVVALVGDKLNR